MPTATLPAVEPMSPVVVPTVSRAVAAFAPVAPDIEAAERVFADALVEYRSPFGPLLSHLKHYRGKRLRPALLLLVAKACGKITPAHHTLAAVVEMIHTATLVHDDVLDEADTRRHHPTFNAEWGNKVSILLGDMLFTHAFHLSATVDQTACRLIGEATNKVCAGELMQITERGNLRLTEADYYAIVDGKTAALTEACGRLGALYAGANAETADAMAEYGRSLGIAFQIADDLLDLTGDATKAGKTLGTDLEQGKLTLPLIHALNTLPAAEADDFRDLLRSANCDRSAVADVLIRSGSLVFAKRTADDFARAARAALEGLPPSDCRAVLESLTEWSVRREK